jgi:heme A synthase
MRVTNGPPASKRTRIYRTIGTLPYTSDGKPLYTKRESVSSDSSSSDDGLSFLAVIILIVLVITVVVTAILAYAVLAPAVAAIRKESKTSEGRQQIRSFALTVAVSISLSILSVATSLSLLGYFSSDLFRLIQFVLTIALWGITLHYGIGREYWRPALESCQYFGRSYIEEFKSTYRSLQHLVERYA